MTSLLERGRRGETLADLDVIDMHGHLGRVGFAVPDQSAEGLVAVMDRIGVKSILCSHVRCMFGRVDVGNRAVLEAMRAAPGRILGYVIVWPAEGDRVRAETARCIDDGFTGIKLHNSNGFPYTEPAYEPALEIANDRRLPVLLHTWGTDEMFSQVRTIAEKFPRLNLLLAHAGSSRVEEYVKIARELENVYLDICMSATPRGLVERLFAEAGHDKVVWGSDATFLNMAHQIGKVLGARLSDEDKRKLLSANARRILEQVER